MFNKVYKFLKSIQASRNWLEDGCIPFLYLITLLIFSYLNKICHIGNWYSVKLYYEWSGRCVLRCAVDYIKILFWYKRIFPPLVSQSRVSLCGFGTSPETRSYRPCWPQTHRQGCFADRPNTEKDNLISWFNWKPNWNCHAFTRNKYTFYYFFIL